MKRLPLVSSRSARRCSCSSSSWAYDQHEQSHRRRRRRHHRIIIISIIINIIIIILMTLIIMPKMMIIAVTENRFRPSLQCSSKQFDNLAKSEIPWQVILRILPEMSDLDPGMCGAGRGWKCAGQKSALNTLWNIYTFFYFDTPLLNILLKNTLAGHF